MEHFDVNNVNLIVSKGCVPYTNACESTEFEWKKPQEMFEDKLVRICAPMVRFSK